MADRPVQKKNWSHRKKLLIWVLVWAGLPLALLVVLALALDRHTREPLDAALRESRDIGGAVTLRELEAARKVWPEEQNGAKLLISLQWELDTIRDSKTAKALPSFSDEGPPPIGQPLSPEKLSVAEAELIRLKPALTAIDGLLQFQGGRFPLKIAPNPIDTLLPYLTRLRTSAKLKADQSLCRMMRGDASHFVNDIAILERHGRLLADEWGMMAALVRIACDSMTLETVERALGLMSLSRDQLAQLDALVAEMGKQDRLSWGLRGERGMFIGAAEYLRREGTLGPALVPPVTVPTTARLIPGLRSTLFLDEATGVRLYNRLVAAAQEPRRALEISKELEGEVARLPSSFVLTHALMFSMAHSIQLDLRLESQLRAARVGLAAERYRLDHRRFPEKLEDLVPQYLPLVPLDPFTDRPLRLRNSGGVLMIYSVGEDLTDDGGALEGWVSKRPYRDWGFILLPPERRGLPASQPASEPAEQREERIRQFRYGPPRADTPGATTMPTSG